MSREPLVALAIGAALLAGCGTSNGSPAPEVATATERPPAAPADTGAPAPPAAPREMPAPGGDAPSGDDGGIELDRDDAPDFDARALDADTRVKLSDHRGKVVVLAFWGID